MRSRGGAEQEQEWTGKRKKENGKKGCCCLIGDIQHSNANLEVWYHVISCLSSYVRCTCSSHLNSIPVRCTEFIREARCPVEC